MSWCDGNFIFNCEQCNIYSWSKQTSTITVQFAFRTSHRGMRDILTLFNYNRFHTAQNISWIFPELAFHKYRSWVKSRNLAIPGISSTNQLMIFVTQYKFPEECLFDTVIHNNLVMLIDTKLCEVKSFQVFSLSILD